MVCFIVKIRYILTSVNSLKQIIDFNDDRWTTHKSTLVNPSMHALDKLKNVAKCRYCTTNPLKYILTEILFLHWVCSTKLESNRILVGVRYMVKSLPYIVIK
jgi:hypothetical protein